MKKKQLVAFAVAAALAVPNTGMVASFANAPVVVEAAAATNTTAGDSLSMPTVTASQKKSEVSTALNEAFAKQRIILNDDTKKNAAFLLLGSLKVNGVGTWSIDDEEQILTQGSNSVNLTFTFDKEKDMSNKAGWRKDASTGQYYGKFTVNIIGSKCISIKDALKKEDWPTVSKKTYDVSGTKTKISQYWEEEVKDKKNAYGVFSIVESENSANASSTGNNTVKVTYTLNPEWVFDASTDTLAEKSGANKSALSKGVYECKKDYTVEQLSKAEIKEIKWPEVKGEVKPVYGGDAEAALVLTDMKDNLIDFEVVVNDDNKTALTDKKFTSTGKVTYCIQAKVKSAQADAASFSKELNPTEDGKVYKEITVDVAKPAISEVKLKDKDDAAVSGSMNLLLNDETADVGKLTAEPKWNTDEADVTTNIYEYAYQWYKDGQKLDGAENAEYEVTTNSAKNTGKYTCKVTATIKDTGVSKQHIKNCDDVVTGEVSINVTVSDIGLKDATTPVSYGGNKAYDGTAQYGKLASDIVYKPVITGVSKDASVELEVVDKDGKAVTDNISVTKGTWANSELPCDVTVKKEINAGEYSIKLKVKDDDKPVTTLFIATCAVKPQKINLKEGNANNTSVVPGITPAKELKHGDSIDKLTFTYVDPVDQDGDVKSEISNKLNITLKDPATTFADGYLSKKVDKVTAIVELKNQYKNNYTFDTTDSEISAVGERTDAVEVSNINSEIGKKEVTVSVADEEILQGAGEPKYKLVIPEGAFMPKDKITVTATGYLLYNKDDKSHTPIYNDIESLSAGEYIIAPETEPTVTSVVSMADCYDVKFVNGTLTIRSASHTVSFNSKGGSDVAEITVDDSKTITAPTPTRAGYKFAGWYTDSKLTKAFDFTAPITKDVTLFAKWEKEEAPSTEKPSTETPSTEKPSTEQPTTQVPTTQATPAAVGTTTKTSTGTYKVTASDASKKTVAFTKAASKSVKKVTIPSTITVNGVSYKVTKIADNAFSGCKKMTKVTIPSTVTEIGASSFKNCTKLTSVTIPKNVTKIGKNAFSGDKKLKTVTIKSTKVKTIGKNAFKGISGKSTIKVPKSKKKAYKKLLKKAGYKKTVK